MVRRYAGSNNAVRRESIQRARLEQQSLRKGSSIKIPDELSTSRGKSTLAVLAEDGSSTSPVQRRMTMASLPEEFNRQRSRKTTITPMDNRPTFQQSNDKNDSTNPHGGSGGGARRRRNNVIAENHAQNMKMHEDLVSTADLITEQSDCQECPIKFKKKKKKKVRLKKNLKEQKFRLIKNCYQEWKKLIVFLNSEHEYFLEVIMWMPLLTMMLYILLIEGAPLCQ